MIMIQLKPIAFVTNSRHEPIDDNWENIISTIELAPDIPEKTFMNIELFSHLEIIYYFHQIQEDKISFSRHPRGNANYPEMGIFAQRNKDRPNGIGLATVSLIGHSGRTITVKYLDAINGTPVLDIKPVFREFMPKSGTKQPDWVADLTQHYW